MKRLAFKNAQRPVKAYRDTSGTPHLYADSWKDALYGLGYLQALDRRTQLVFSRIIAEGRGSECIANHRALKQRDYLLRPLLFMSPPQEDLARLDEETVTQLESYCEGVTDGLREAGRSLPMWMVGLQPEEWSLQAIMMVGNLLNFAGLALGQQRNERRILDLARSGCAPEKIRDLYSPYYDDADFDLLNKLKSPNLLNDSAVEKVLAELPAFVASNAWAVSPQKSATGNALLASDPHLDIQRLPTVWYESVLHWKDQWLMGASLPGTPMFAVARTSQLAWGVTYSMGDSSDSFIEDCRVQGEKVEYRRGDDWHPFEEKSEAFAHKKTEPETRSYLRNELGLLEGDPRKSGDGYYLNLAWSGYAGSLERSLSTWLKLPQMTTTETAMELVRDEIQPPLCWVFADQEGHIGYQVSGRFPVRGSSKAGLCPLPAWEEEHHWQGWLEPDKLPRLYDPPEGFICSANEDLNRPDLPTITTLPATNYRLHRLRDLLEETDQVRLEDCRHWQYDTISKQPKRLLPVLLESQPDSDLKAKLLAWDGNYSLESVEATLFEMFYKFLLIELFGRPSEDGRQGLGESRVRFLTTQAGYGLVLVRYFDQVLMQESSAWFTREEKQAAVARILDLLAHKHDIQPWGEVHQLTIRNAFISGKLGGWLGLHRGPMPMFGNHATPFQAQLVFSGKKPATFAPSYHFVTDLAEREAWTNLPGGASENLFSPHYADDLKLWKVGTYKQLSASALEKLRITETKQTPQMKPKVRTS
ncbi:Penicillin acylase family protein [Planctomycetales bacterium 10988]|nr:Penicillin acylase family protein [Planctomycetales bacterium 10988]